MTKRKSLGVLFCVTLLICIVITNVPLRGMWSVVVIAAIIMLSLLFALLKWWEKIFDTLSYLDIRINMGGYLFISGVLFVIWLLTFLFFDQQIYIVFKLQGRSIVRNRDRRRREGIRHDRHDPRTPAERPVPAHDPRPRVGRPDRQDFWRLSRAFRLTQRAVHQKESPADRGPDPAAGRRPPPPDPEPGGHLSRAGPLGKSATDEARLLPRRRASSVVLPSRSGGNVFLEGLDKVGGFLVLAQALGLVLGLFLLVEGEGFHLLVRVVVDDPDNPLGRLLGGLLALAGLLGSPQPSSFSLRGRQLLLRPRLLLLVLLLLHPRPLPLPGRHRIECLDRPSRAPRRLHTARAAPYGCERVPLAMLLSSP